MQKEELKKYLNEKINEGGYEVKRTFFESSAGEPDMWSKDEYKNFWYSLEADGVGFEHQDSYGGEGLGEEYWSVYSFTKDDTTVYIKFDGWYQSYNGSEYQEWFFVEPKEVVVTQYFPVNS